LGVCNLSSEYKGSIHAQGKKVDPPYVIGLASFSTAICAWDSTEDEVVYELVQFLDEKFHLWPEYAVGCPISLLRMSRYPGFMEDMVHPGALKYCKKKGIEVGGAVLLRILK
jgi:hypothetical protein